MYNLLFKIYTKPFKFIFIIEIKIETIKFLKTHIIQIIDLLKLNNYVWNYS